MAEYLSPGVYVEERIEKMPPPDTVWSPRAATDADESTRITLLGPGAAAFIGISEKVTAAREEATRGVAPHRVESWPQFVEFFGDCLDRAHLPHAVRGFFANGGRAAYVISIGTCPAGAPFPALSPQDFEGDYAQHTGLAGLEDLDDVTVVCAPDIMSCAEHGNWSAEDVVRTQLALIAFCEKARSCIALLDVPPGLAPHAVHTWRMQAAVDSAFGALYYPWLRTDVGGDSKPRLVPPCGHVAGAWVRAHESQGPHGTSANLTLADAVDLEFRIRQGEQDFLNPLGVNALRVFSDGAVRIWGARTLSSDPGLRVLPDRMLTQTIARSLERGATWAIFRRNDTALHEHICTALYGFLAHLWRRGSLVGDNEREAFYVGEADYTGGGALVIPIGFAAGAPGVFTELRVVFASDQFRSGRGAELSLTDIPTPSSAVSAPSASALFGPEVFLSYSRADWDEYVEDLVRLLRDDGFNVWVDQHLLRGGENWMDAINKALARCPVMVLCVSPDALISKHVKYEYRHFFKVGKPILPVICRPAELPPEISDLQYLEHRDRARLATHLKALIA